MLKLKSKKNFQIRDHRIKLNIRNDSSLLGMKILNFRE
jgi:hypothetical protein